MAVADPPHATHQDHHEHGHAPFIAHHFDSAEQQFDSGKLGIWIFLVTEVLFFSGLFVAYTLWRCLHPEIFEQAHVFLDKYLGALNTIVLLFSSFTMAWAVRCSQLAKNNAAAILILITMVCGAMFLGVKAIEYSHKWDQGILVRSAFAYSGQHAEATGIAAKLGISNYLVYLCLIPTVLLVAAAGFCIYFKAVSNNHLFKFFGGVIITLGGYFLGVFAAYFYMEFTGGGVGGTHASRTLILHAATQQPDDHATQSTVASGQEPAAGIGKVDQHAQTQHAEVAGGEHTDHGPDPNKFDRDIGTFFSIYYCMTGLHAFHIMGGVMALGWLYWRSLLGQWRPDYFGPVDYVGLYWHLVDVIWIFLFPMLYLID